MSQLAIRGNATWSGGGGSVMSNILLAARNRPELFDLTSQSDQWLIPLNRVPLRELRSGNFLYMPQNAWAWHGPANRNEWPRRAILRSASTIAMKRSAGLVRIGPMIPAPPSGRPGYVSAFLPNVLDDEFEADLEQSADLSPQFDAPVIYSCGSMWSYRGLEQLIEAHGSYQRAGGTCELMLCGPSASSAYVDALRATIPSWQRATLQPNRIDRAQNIANMRAAALTVFPSYVEASPVSLLEALVARSPIAARNIEANSFLLEANDVSTAGLLFDDAASLAERMLNLPDRPDVTNAKLGDAAQRLQARETWCDTFAAICEDYLERSR